MQDLGLIIGKWWLARPGLKVQCQVPGHGLHFVSGHALHFRHPVKRRQALLESNLTEE